LKFESEYIEKPIVVPIEGKKVIKLGKLATKAGNGVKCNIESSGEDIKVTSFYTSNNSMYVVLESEPDKAKVGSMGRFVLTLIARKGRDFMPIGSLPSWEYRIGQRASVADKAAADKAEADAKKQEEAAKAKKSEKKSSKKKAKEEAAKKATT